jgi:flavodoxin I
MQNISIIYWSGSGNTEKMANLIHDGLKSKGESPRLLPVSEASVSDVASSDLVVLGSPSMGAEVIEEAEMDRFIEEIKTTVSGKKVALFGSYGWGDGEWMREWEKRMLGYGVVLTGEGLIVNETPEGKDILRCIEFGKALV